MRLIFQEVDALAVLQLHKFSDERLLTGVSLNYRFRPEAVVQRMAANGRSKLLAVVQLRNTNDCGGPKQSLWVETSAAVCASFLE